MDNRNNPRRAVMAGVLLLGALAGGMVLADHELQARASAARTPLRDCADKDTTGSFICPLLAEVPAGSFVMGAPDGAGDASEHPRHAVALRQPLLAGIYPVTRGEYTACVAARACRPAGDAEFTQNDRHPVVMVNYQDARDYASWLSGKTGRHYRLPSEAEWEYLARGGAATTYPWGDTIGAGNANCADCGTRWDNYSTSPVGSFRPNGFGLYDVVGNVWEWTADCYHPDYRGAPADGSPWGSYGCELRTVRSGAWNETSVDSRLAARRDVYPQTRNYDMGFRVVRDVQ